MQIAFFDVDNTLLRGNSGYFTVRELIRRKIIKKKRLPVAVYYRLLNAFFYTDIRRMYETAIADMVGLSVDEVLQIGSEVFERDLKPRMYREALAAVEASHKENRAVILLSSGPWMTIRTIERFLSAQASHAIGPAVADNRLLGRLAEPFCHGPGKADIARAEAQARGTQLDQCAFYGDSITELPLMSIVGEPRIVNPDRGLRKAAQQHGWPILQFTEVLGGA